MTTTASSPVAAQTQHDSPKRRLFTVDELYVMDAAGMFDGDERIELLDGEIIIMPPTDPPEEDGTDRLNRDLNYSLYHRMRVRTRGPVRINDYNLSQPDVTVLQPREDYHRRGATAEDVLLLIEVADTSLEYDREVKLPRYAAAGIPEVWIVNVRARQVEAYSDPVDGEYRSRRVVAADGSISPLAFPDVSLAVADFLLE